MDNSYQVRLPLAFISCSLRDEDRHFTNWVVKLTAQFGFQPFGTVGLLSASPNSIPHDMREMILQADCLVLAAVNRYSQTDVHDSSKTSFGMSEMMHTEVGLAHARGIPVLAFVLEGTGVGSFLPQFVQYIPIRPGDQVHLNKQFPLIHSYFENAKRMIAERWRKEQTEDLKKAAGWLLSTIGGFAIISTVFSDGDEDSGSASD